MESLCFGYNTREKHNIKNDLHYMYTTHGIHIDLYEICMATSKNT